MTEILTPAGAMGDPSHDRAPLRVALVLGPSTDGMGRHVRSLVQGLTARGMRVDVYCSAAAQTRFHFAEAAVGPAGGDDLVAGTDDPAAGTDDPAVADAGPQNQGGRHRDAHAVVEVPGVRVTLIDIPVAPGPRDVSVVSQLRRALRAVDLIHAHGLRAGFLAAIARSGDTPLIVSWHQAFSTPPLARLANRGIGRTVAGVAELSLCASEELLATARRFGAKDARLCLVPAPVLPTPVRDAAEVRDEFGLAAETPLLLSVGRLHAHDRHDVLVSAAARWRFLRPVPTVIIEGTGPAYRDLAAQIIINRAPVILAGHRSDLADLLHAADLAVITGDGESRQEFAQEALASGLALVVAEHGGLPAIVGDAAVLVPAGDVDALDAAVRSLLEHPDRRARLTAAGLAIAETWPSEEDTVAEVVTAYREVAARSHSTPATH